MPTPFTLTPTPEQNAAAMGTTVQPSPQGPASLQGTMVGSQPSTASSALPQPSFGFGQPGTQLNFANYMQMAIDRLNAVNPMLQQRQLLLKHIYDTPLSPQELSQLSPEMQKTIQSGDKQEQEMAVRLLNDQISGRSNTMNQAMQFLTTGYQESIQSLQDLRKQQVDQAQFLIKNTPSAVLRKTYSPQQLDALGAALGMPKGTLSDPNFKTDKDIQLQTAATSAGSLALAREAMAASRYASAIKSTITSFYPSGKSPIQNYGASSQAINRIDQSLSEATNPSNPNKGAADLDLIDAYVQIARGGQAITEAQVDTLLRSLGIAAKFDVGLQKITGSATLDDGTRKEIATLAHKIFSGQQSLAQKATDQINSQLTKQGIPSEYLLSSPDEASSYYNLGTESTGGGSYTSASGNTYTLPY